MAVIYGTGPWTATTYSAGSPVNDMQGKLEEDLWILMDFGAENSGLNFIPMNSFRHATPDCKIPIPKDSTMMFGMNPNI